MMTLSRASRAALVAWLLWSAKALAAPAMYYHGELQDASGNAVASQAVDFKVTIKAPSQGTCTLYEETHSITTGSDGSFTIPIGGGSPTAASSTTITGAFRNDPATAITAADATSCQSGTTYTPSTAYDTRLFVLSFKVGSGSWDSFPAETIAQTAFALYAGEAAQVAGLGPTNLLRVDNTAASSNTTAFNSTQFASLVALVNGTSTQYVPSTSASGAAMPSYNGAPSTLAAGSIWFDTSSNELKYYNGTGVMVVGAAGGGSGTVTGITVGAGLVDGTGAAGTVITTSGTIALPNVGTAGAYYKVTTDAQGRVSSGAASLAEADIPTLTTAGKVSGGAINSGTIGGAAAVNTSGNIVTSGGVSSNTDSTNNLRIFEATNTSRVLVTAPAGVNNYGLVLPTGLPASNGQVLTSDTSGNLSWTTPASGTVTSVGVTSPILNTGTASAPVIAIQQANGTQAGYLSSGDWTTFNSKLGPSLTNGSIWVGNAGGTATAVAPSGDVTMTNAGGFTVTKIQGVAVSAAAPTTAGQVLRYDGTSAYVAAQLSTSDISGLTTALTNKIDASQMPANCAANQTLTFSSPTGAWSCSSIAITGSAFGSQTQNLVLASPDGSAGNPIFRSLVANDIPNLSAAKITSGTLAVANGGTGTSNGSISGTGALTFQAGGSNQNVTLAPSGTGYTILGGNVGIGTTSPGSELDVKGALRLEGATSGYAGFQAPASMTTSVVWTLPAADGSNGQVLTSNGSGTLTWSTPAGLGISALTGDVTASGSGSVAATVNSVGGSTAANIHAAELLANAATNANTASAIVKRDASGNFAAGAITSTSQALKDSGSNNVTLSAPTNVTASYSLKLPAAVAASNGQVLSSDTSGNLSWATPGTGSVTSVAAGDGLTGGTITTSGTISLANIAAYNLLANNSGAAAAPGATTLTALMDNAIGNTQGSILYRNATGWTALGPGTNGQVLKSGGAGANPLWAAGGVSSQWTTSGGNIYYNTGNVGIGTSSPGSTLDVVGGISASGDIYTGSNVQAGQLQPSSGSASSPGLNFGGNNTGVFESSGNIGFALSGTERMRIAASGKVGIGTTAPGASLDISAKTDAIALPKGTTAQQPVSPAAGWIRYNTSNSAVEFYNGSAWTTLSTAGGSYLPTSGGTLSGALTISGGGASITGGINNNAGGITNAGSLTGVGANITGSGAMTVAAGGTAQNLTLSSSTTGSVNVGSGNGTSLSILDGGASTVNSVTVKGAAAGGSPTIATAGSDANINLTFTPKGSGKTIFSSGSVGIGTTAPSANLHLVSSGNSVIFNDSVNAAPSAQFIGRTGRGTLVAPSAAQSGDELALFGGRGYGATGFGVSSSAAIRMMADENFSDSAQGAFITLETTPTGATGRAERMRITSSGNVGIGTASPSSPLTVNGMIESKTSGFKFPDGSIQTAAATAAPVPVGSTVATSESATGNAYADLTTSGPSVTVSISGTGTALVTITAQSSSTSPSGTCSAAIEVSGATAIAAADAYSRTTYGTAAIQSSSTYLITGLTAGSNTFKLQYKASTPSCNFSNRSIIVIPY